MKNIQRPLLLAITLGAALALAACSNSNDSTQTTPAPPSSSAHPNAPLAGTPTPTPMTPATAGSTSVTLGSVELGSAVDAGNKVMMPSGSFAPSDSIYASVNTQGTGDATLAVKWTYQDGQIVHQDSKTLHANGSQTTSFMIKQPGGFPTGNYALYVSINGTQVADKAFSVK